MQGKRIQWEYRYTSSFMREYFKGYEIKLNTYLGPYPLFRYERGLSPEERNLTNVYRYRCDGLAINHYEVVLVEAALKEFSTHVGKIETYAKVLSHTSELEKHHGKELRFVLVVPFIDRITQELCDERGIEVVEYYPDFIKSYLNTREARKNRPILTSMTLEEQRTYLRKPSFIT